jgi:pyruvate formate lyase activating enzyme
MDRINSNNPNGEQRDIKDDATILSSVARIDQSGLQQGVITNIQSYSIHDGPGIRTLVFLKGCPLRCQWCCNPENLDQSIEIEFYSSKCIRCGTCLDTCDIKAINPDLEVKSDFKIDRTLCNLCGKCVEGCPKEAIKSIGRNVSVDEVLEQIQKDKYYYLTSKGGLTISGGEPFLQFEFTRELLKRSYNEHIDTAIETCGYTSWKYFLDAIPYINLVLFDIKHMNSEKHKQHTGVPNQLILSNLKKLSTHGIPVMIRIPLIPGFNSDKDNMHKTAGFVLGLNNIMGINLLPFHQLGKDKYYRLSHDYMLEHLADMSSHKKGREEIESIRDIFESYGLCVTIGG